jgi:trehalose 6-phosphate phosphatase
VYESDSGSDNARLASNVCALLRHGRAGLVTDIDGTISPIVARPQEAVVLPRARQALAGLRQHLATVAVVTGRSVLDARQMVGLDGLTYIGNHGMEVLVDGHAETVAEARPWVARVSAVLDQVHLQLGNADGVIIENKGATASLHYRLAPHPDEMRRTFLEILARYAVTSGLRVEEGRRVINLLPPLTVSKGSAVSRLVREHDLESIVYLGDDLTDAHAFRALDVLRETRGLRALSIGVVGPETPPSVRQFAGASVPSVAAVAELLWRVLDGLKSSDRMESRAPSVGRESSHG